MNNRHPRFTLVIGCVIFIFFGVITASLGPILPELSENTESSLAAVGGVYTALFLGALVSQLIAGPLSDRVGTKVVLFVSLIVLGAGVIGFTNASSLWMMLLITFLTGLGHGSVDLCVNILVSRTYTEKNASVMNLLHFFFGVGAFTGPALVSLSLSTVGNGMLVLWAAAVGSILMAILVTRVKNPGIEAHPQDQDQGNVYRSSTLWLMGAVLLIYVGVENGLGGWSTTYTNQTTGLSLEKSALVSSGYWGALTLGRLAAALVGVKIPARRLLLITFILSLAMGLVFAAFTGFLVPTIVSILSIGFFTGAVYPTMMSVIISTFSHAPGKAASVGAAMGSIGGMLIPLAQGYLQEEVSPNASAWYIAGGLALMLATLLLSNGRKPAGLAQSIPLDK
jgi:fucose permease